MLIVLIALRAHDDGISPGGVEIAVIQVKKHKLLSQKVLLTFGPSLLDVELCLLDSEAQFPQL